MVKDENGYVNKMDLNSFISQLEGSVLENIASKVMLNKMQKDNGILKIQGVGKNMNAVNNIISSPQKTNN
jgi:hypothetical protein